MHSAFKHILLIDDNKVLLKALEAAIGPDSHKVCMAWTSHGVMTCIHQHRPDIVALDLFLPDVDGFEIMRIVKQQLPKTRTIIVSGSALAGNPHYREMLAELGADATLNKPYTPQMLLEAALGEKRG